MRRSAVTADNFWLRRGLHYPGRVRAEAAVCVVGWKSPGHHHLVQKRQKGESIVWLIPKRHLRLPPCYLHRVFGRDLVTYAHLFQINSVTKSTDKTVTSELTILANVTDNQARYRCEAHNAATEIPLFETKTLSVHFAPETVKIRAEPEELKPNMEATLFCDSSSSNPPAQLTWWRDGIPVDTITNSSKPGLWGGTVSSAELRVNVTEDMNGIIYTCQSTNSALERSVHEALTLHVLCNEKNKSQTHYRFLIKFRLFRFSSDPPVFTKPPSNKAVEIENESLQVRLVARANPDSIAYTWTKDGAPITNSGRVVSEGPLLNFTKLARSDAGLYTCEAVNSQGSATINIIVDVECNYSFSTDSTKIRIRMMMKTDFFHC